MQLPQAFLHVPGLLKGETLQQADDLIGRMDFSDGKATATGAAKAIKSNLQAVPDAGEALKAMQELVTNAIYSHPVIHSAIMPGMILPPMISRYEPGMHYGWHTDSPLMGSAPTIRVDASMTLFLSDPQTYTGGELSIHTPSGILNYKPAKGDAIIYPTTRLHGVNQVVSGVRVAAVTWMQCVVREADKRELLFQLKSVQEMVAASNQNGPENLILMQIYSNLLRLWAEM